MKQKIEVISKTHVKVIRQAQILGFIDRGSTTEEEYGYDDTAWWWRSMTDGAMVDIDLYLDIENAVANLIENEARNTFLNTLASKAKSE